MSCAVEVIALAPTSPVERVKLFVAILYGTSESLDEARQRLQLLWGPLDYGGPDHLFDMTDYYDAEMGCHLLRRLISFERLVAPETLRQAKLATNQLEDQLAIAGHRQVNLDVGYLDHNKVVLGSVKYAGQKIHLGDGIYADLVGRYRDGRYQPFEWTFPDFRDGRYDQELTHMRAIYLRQRKEGWTRV